MGPWIASLGEQGFSPEDAAVAVEFAITLALDCSAQMARLRRTERAQLKRDDLPALKAYDNDEVWSGRGMYDRKLEILVGGLSARRLASAPAAAPAGA